MRAALFVGSAEEDKEEFDDGLEAAVCGVLGELDGAVAVVLGLLEAVGGITGPGLDVVTGGVVTGAVVVELGGLPSS